MKRLTIYNLLEANEISLEDAAKAFGLTVTDIKFRLTRYGANLPKVLTVLDKIEEGRMTRSEAAEALGVTGRNINRAMETWNVSRPVKEYLIDRIRANVSKEVRRVYAIEFIEDMNALSSAAEHAGISERRIYSWASAMLRKHRQPTLREVRKMSVRDRNRVIAAIKKGEALDAMKEKIAHAVGEGRKEMTQEVAERILSRRLKDTVRAAKRGYAQRRVQHVLNSVVDKVSTKKTRPKKA